MVRQDAGPRLTDRYILSPSFIGDPDPALRKLARPDWRINDVTAPPGDATSRMAVVHRGLGRLAAQALAGGERPVCVNGDCCAAIGVAAALQTSGITPVLLWLDAHGDFNTWETTRSGFVGGMPLAMLVGRGEQVLLRAAGVSPLSERDVVLCDARDLDPLERELLNASAVRHEATLAGAASAVHQGRPVWIHFDMDIVDPADAPATRYAAPGGPRRAEMLAFARSLATSEQVVALSATVWDVPNDKDGRTGEVCLELLQAFLGR